jgi:glycine cleavage system H protein
MSQVPDDLQYTKDHEWVRTEGEELVVGITDYAQESLGDITFVELPGVGASFSQGDTFGVVESVKAASDLYAPVSGEVIAINDGVDAAPETVNSSPYADGWLIRMKPADSGEMAKLLDAKEYGNLI